MFTGLIQTTGKISKLSAKENYRVITVDVDSTFGPLTTGESISCDGACLTVIEHTGNSVVVEASQETLARTTLGQVRVGSIINLERALKVGDRLGGHFVTGHVDTIGNIVSIRPVGQSVEITVEFDREYAPLVVDKGSVALNGISLTVNACPDDQLSVNIIPHTLDATTLGNLSAGDKVNIEFDLLGKYILRASGKPQPRGLTIEQLLASGW